jgi:hypothetical protein
MDRPVGAVLVPMGAVAVLLETRKRILDPTVHKAAKRKAPRILQRSVWEVRKGAVRKFRRGCATDWSVEKKMYHGGRLVSTTRIPFDRPHKSRNSYRLRVAVNGVHEYAHKIAAFCFHRSAVPAGTRWATFRKGWEGDHLPDAQLRVKPEWAMAGWVEAARKRVHQKRSKQFGHARLVARKEAELHDLQHKEKELQEQFSKLAANAASKGGRGLKRKLQNVLKKKQQWRRVQVRRKTVFLSWDIQDIDDPQFADNPYLPRLFVDSGLSPRRALLALIDKQLRWSQAFLLPAGCRL